MSDVSGTYKIDTTYLSLTGQDLWVDLNTDLDTLSLAERSNVIELDRKLHTQWGLGRNFILGWAPQDTGIELLSVPHYVVADYALAERYGSNAPTHETGN